MRRILCMVIGHGHQTTKQDGKGAAWSVCDRCGEVTASHSWHGGKPWL